MPASHEISALQLEAEKQGGKIREIKERVAKDLRDSGSSAAVNQHPEVLEAVRILIQLKGRAAMMEGELKAAEELHQTQVDLAAAEARCIGAIWELRPVELHFEAPDRPTARLLAECLVPVMCPDRPRLKK